MSPRGTPFRLAATAKATMAPVGAGVGALEHPQAVDGADRVDGAGGLGIVTCAGVSHKSSLQYILHTTLAS